MNSRKSGKDCFIVCPIGDEGSDVRNHSDWLFEGIVKPVLAELKEFNAPTRADKISQPGMIDTQVIELLLDADLVIADLSLLNPNVFYEIGIRHMTQKPIVHMQLKSDRVPFDVSGYRAIKFALKHPSDLADARRELTDAIKLASSEDHRVENPVTHARGRIKIEQNASPENKVLLDEINSLRERMSLIESRPKTQSGAATSTKNPALFLHYSVGANLKKLADEINRIVGDTRASHWSINPENGFFSIQIHSPRMKADELGELLDKLSGETRALRGAGGAL